MEIIQHLLYVRFCGKIPSGGGSTMTMEQKVKMALAYKGISQAKLAEAMKTTASNFNQKLKRETFTVEELEKMAECLGAKYYFGFEFEDGTKI